MKTVGVVIALTLVALVIGAIASILLSVWPLPDIGSGQCSEAIVHSSARMAATRKRRRKMSWFYENIGMILAVLGLAGPN